MWNIQLPLLQVTLYRLLFVLYWKKNFTHSKYLNVKIIFSPFKLSTMFSPKDFVPDSLKSRVVYQSTCASSGVRYIGETNRHFNTRVNEHLFRDKNSHIFKHLSASKGCRDKCDISCFKILDHASTYSQLKIKESFHIEQLKPELNKQVQHVSLLVVFLNLSTAVYREFVNYIFIMQADDDVFNWNIETCSENWKVLCVFKDIRSFVPTWPFGKVVKFIPFNLIRVSEGLTACSRVDSTSGGLYVYKLQHSSERFLCRLHQFCMKCTTNRNELSSLDSML